MKTYFVDFVSDIFDIGLCVVVCANNRHAAKRKATKMVKNKATKEIREDLEFIGTPVFYDKMSRNKNKFVWHTDKQNNKRKNNVKLYVKRKT